MEESAMGIFDFARDAGESLRKAITGRSDVDAQDLAEALRAKNVTLEGGQIRVSGDTVTVTGKASNHAEKELAVLILGNTKGVAKVDDQITVGAAASPAGQTSSGGGAQASRFYTVKSGDTLSKIAKEMYGDASRYPEIFKANQPMLTDPDKIYPGQSLRIPADTVH